MGYEEFTVSMTNRSIRTIKAELEFLADNDAISRQQLNTFLSQLPEETSITGQPVKAATNGIKALGLTNGLRATEKANNTSFNEKANHSYNDPPAYSAPSPAPPPPGPPAPTVLAHAVSLYVYNGTDAGDLNLQANDKVAVTEYMNAEWWKGRNERTGQEGIFPRSYVRLEEKSVPQQSNYGNMPLDVSSGAQAASDDPKKKGTASKIGGKLGNAAIFGAGATIGSNIVNSIF